MTGQIAPSWVIDAVHEGLAQAHTAIRQMEESKARQKAMQDGLAAAARALDEVTDPTSRKVLDLHHRGYYGDYSWHYHCPGCDTGCSCDSATWPCSTVRLVAELHGIDVPGDLWDVLERPADGSLDAGPSEGY